MPDRRFDNGDRVMAKWPGTTLFYPGQIKDFNDIEYLVVFDDDDSSEVVVKYKDVEAANFNRARSRSRGRSPARSKKSPARKSPARAAPSGKSPGRPRGPSKSPGRKAATTPTRAAAVTTNSVVTTKKETKTAAKKETKAAVVASPDTSTTKTRATRGSKSPSRNSTNNTSVSSSTSSTKSSIITATVLTNINSTSAAEEARKLLAPIRQSVRISAITTKVNDISTSTLLTNSTGNSTYSPRSSSTGAGCSVRCCAAAAWGVLWPAIKTIPVILFTIALPLLFTQACTKKKCSIMDIPDMPVKKESYYDPLAVAIVLGGLFLQLILSFIPIRSKVLPNGAKARGNAMVCLLLTLLLLPLAVYLKQDVQLMYKLLRQLLTAHTVVAVVLALLLYAKSFYSPRSQLNSKAPGNFLPDLFIGRECAPRVGSLDVKSFILRYMAIYSVVFNIVLIMRQVQGSKTGAYNEPLIAACAMQIIMCVDLLWCEDGIFTMFEYTREGLGLFYTILMTTLPFFFAVTPRYIMNYQKSLPWYCTAGCVLLFLTGYILQRSANSQKHAFRTNPSSPALAHLESVPTSGGSRLLVSGWWGTVRHPNYLGDILSQLGLVLLCGFSHGLPWAMYACSFLSLMKRMYDNELACQAKYGLSWANYTGRVKYMLVPRVF